MQLSIHGQPGVEFSVPWPPHIFWHRQPPSWPSDCYNSEYIDACKACPRTHPSVLILRVGKGSLLVSIDRSSIAALRIRDVSCVQIPSSYCNPALLKDPTCLMHVHAGVCMRIPRAGFLSEIFCVAALRREALARSCACSKHELASWPRK